MASINKCCFIGNLGKDPESKYLPSGVAVVNFSIACNEQWKDKDTGEKKEHVEWIRCVCYGKLAEIITKYVTKGAQIYVEGKQRTRKYEDKEGVERYTTEIVVGEMKMLGSKGGGGAREEGQAEYPEAARSAPPEKPARGAAARNEPTHAAMDDFSDDIPF